MGAELEEHAMETHYSIEMSTANTPSRPPASLHRTKSHDKQVQAMANRVREHWQTVMAALPPHAHAAVVRTSGMAVSFVIERVLCIECVLYLKNTLMHRSCEPQILQCLLW